MSKSTSNNNNENDVEVTLEDQKRINEFGKLAERKREIRDELKQISSKIEFIKDSQDECLLADDDLKIKFQVGESYANVTKERAEQLLEAELEKYTQKHQKLKDEQERILGTMKILKKALYDKFGSSNINLSDDESE